VPTRPLPFALSNAHQLGPRAFRGGIVARMIVPRRYRELYEGHLYIAGQMSFEDRRVLYDTIRRLRPTRCFEVGTWRGGGSTLVVARALHDNGAGELHTIETVEEVHRAAVAGYEKHVPQLLPFVEFHLGDYRHVFPPIIERDGGVDFFVLDGAEDGDQTVEQFEFFDALAHPGTELFAHDWQTEKTRLLRPALEQTARWTVTTVVGAPKSAGLAVAHRTS
jgi:predicted O-methyltransferase YrrM